MLLRRRPLVPGLVILPMLLAACGHDTASPPTTAARSTTGVPTTARTSSAVGVSPTVTPPATTTPPTTWPTTVAFGTSPATDRGPIDENDPAARVRAAAQATAAEAWFAVTVQVSFQAPGTTTYHHGVQAGCGSTPSYAAYTVPNLLQDLGALRAADESADGSYDPGPGAGVADFFYDVRLDGEGRLASASWYGGELATSYTFDYDIEPAAPTACPGTTVP